MSLKFHEATFFVVSMEFALETFHHTIQKIQILQLAILYLITLRDSPIIVLLLPKKMVTVTFQTN